VPFDRHADERDQDVTVGTPAGVRRIDSDGRRRPAGGRIPRWLDAAHSSRAGTRDSDPSDRSATGMKSGLCLGRRFGTASTPSWGRRQRRTCSETYGRSRRAYVAIGRSPICCPVRAHLLAGFNKTATELTQHLIWEISAAAAQVEVKAQVEVEVEVEVETSGARKKRDARMAHSTRSG